MFLKKNKENCQAKSFEYRKHDIGQCPDEVQQTENDEGSQNETQTGVYVIPYYCIEAGPGKRLRLLLPTLGLEIETGKTFLFPGRRKEK